MYGVAVLATAAAGLLARAKRSRIAARAQPSHGIKFEYSQQKDAHADYEFINDVGYLPDGTPLNKAGNAINHPETIGPDTHTPGSPLPRAIFTNSVGYLPDGTPLNAAGNAVNHPETMQPDTHIPGSPLPPSFYAADTGYLVDGTDMSVAGNRSVQGPPPAAAPAAAPAPGAAAPAAMPGMTVSMQEVESAQKSWGDAIKNISRTYLDGGDYVGVAANAAGELYGYGHGNVLFKPTKASDVQFRPEAEQAMSYFVGADAIEGGISEDHGFAINGGKGWSDVIFNNHQIDLNGNVAIAMGNYCFTSASDGSISKVEYTFGYKKCQVAPMKQESLKHQGTGESGGCDGKVRICLHHSSVPYQGAGMSVSMEEVKAAQRAWADAIKNISKAYLDGDDYVAVATRAAGELYGYGHGNVLFKPTKAKDMQFRPEASQALSYFVGADAVTGGISEDHGFAINGGKGWSDVLFDNHQIDLNGNVAIAMGNYFFASAEDGSISKVEYTFGYKKCQDIGDGQVKEPLDTQMIHLSPLHRLPFLTAILCRFR
ncbi:Ribulose bisphosphate carboxylase, chloroplastic [Symbiodinium microadriaticum]|uniref:Ribulose bisphosphate carboxylase, chloroplastic n=1 Tax=Symbiodinium microadriaticum TaxID=2951 RepID=A0A1Q9DAC9_SYMMI|nr:Ribulose bisphosphate carboxylase, chloroplastic [Symbiodinium microadriaticum]